MSDHFSAWKLFREDLDTCIGKNNLLLQILFSFFSAKYIFIRNVRLAHFFWTHRWLGFGSLIRKYCKMEMLLLFNSDVHCCAEWGRRIHIAHPCGIVIGKDAKIGNDVTLYQHVTLGARKRDDGNYPILEDGVIIYAGACLIGGITVGHDSIIGANCLLKHDCPADSVVSVRSDCCRIKRGGKR